MLLLEPVCSGWRRRECKQIYHNLLRRGSTTYSRKLGDFTYMAKVDETTHHSVTITLRVPLTSQVWFKLFPKLRLWSLKEWSYLRMDCVCEV